MHIVFIYSDLVHASDLLDDTLRLKPSLMLLDFVLYAFDRLEILDSFDMQLCLKAVRTPFALEQAR